MTLTITPAKLSGAVTPPPSKSQAHRLLIAAALADGVSVLDNIAYSQDVDATLRCLEELGAEFAPVDAASADLWGGPPSARCAPISLRVTGIGANAMSPLRRMAYPRLDCGESGSTLRFLIPVALAVRGGGEFIGHGRLMERPLGPYFDLFREKNIFFEQTGNRLTVQGLLTPGEYRLPGNVSSQFFTGLLFALPLLDGPSVLAPQGELESWDYVTMTLEAQGRFGVEFPTALSLPPQYHPQGNQTYRPARAAVEADWSQAGFWYAARALGSAVEVEGLEPRSAQGDRVLAEYDGLLRGLGEVTLDVSQCPDLVPALAVQAALRAGQVTHIVNAGRLRAKESDRLAAVTAVLGALGGDIAQGADSLTISGRERLTGGGTVDSFGDHRIAMMAAVAATVCEKPVTLTGSEAVNKSYPTFWAEYVRLGGKVEEERL